MGTTKMKSILGWVMEFARTHKVYYVASVLLAICLTAAMLPAAAFAADAGTNAGVQPGRALPARPDRAVPVPVLREIGYC